VRDPFAEVNRRYGLKLHSGAPVCQPGTGRRGRVEGVQDGRWLRISWDGCAHVQRPSGCGCGRRRAAFGPFHPTEGLEYPDQPQLAL
jgi:hypothetical protein